MKTLSLTDRRMIASKIILEVNRKVKAANDRIKNSSTFNARQKTLHLYPVALLIKESEKLRKEIEELEKQVEDIRSEIHEFFNDHPKITTTYISSQHNYTMEEFVEVMNHNYLLQPIKERELQDVQDKLAIELLIYGSNDIASAIKDITEQLFETISGKTSLPE